MILNVYKKVGETPLERLDRLRVERPELKNETLSYAGRLDPLAQGVMLVLVGEEDNVRREEFLGLDKEYTFDVLFGVSTDTHDLLGLVEKIRYDLPAQFSSADQKKLENEIAKLKGKFTQQYPVFSSKTVKGKPLFEWAKEGRLGEIEIPTNEVEIYSIEILKDLIGKNYLTGIELKEKALSAAKIVKGDFRQKEIAALWEKMLADHRDALFSFITFHISCSSGTYVRGIADRLGKTMGTSAVALNIRRTKIGTYEIAGSIE